jgi:hypothetical protein
MANRVAVGLWPMMKFRVGGTTTDPDWTSPGGANICQSAEMAVIRAQSRKGAASLAKGHANMKPTIPQL